MKCYVNCVIISVLVTLINLSQDSNLAFKLLHTTTQTVSHLLETVSDLLEKQSLFSAISVILILHISIVFGGMVYNTYQSYSSHMTC